MVGGFTFCGIDIADLNLVYAPDHQNTYVYNSSKRKINEQIFEAHMGGYYFGASIQPKEFTLRCYYNGEHIEHGIMTDIAQVFRVGNTGRLVFQRRPWVYYNATVQSFDISQMTNFMNGIVTIKMKSYFPLGRCDDLIINEDYKDLYRFTEIEENSALLPEEYAPTLSFVPGANDLNFELYNGGTEYAPVAIKIAGNVGDGVTIENETTKQKCHIVALNTPDNAPLVIDSLSGKVTKGDEFAFLYHDYGFINLKPAYPVVRNMQVRRISNNNEYETSVRITNNHIRKSLVFSPNQKTEIVSIDNGYKIKCLQNIGDIGELKNAFITEYNKLKLTHDGTGSNITKLEFEYKPTFT